MSCLSTTRIEYSNKVDSNVTTENCTFIDISKILGGGGGAVNYLHPHKKSSMNLFFLISNPDAKFAGIQKDIWWVSRLRQNVPHTRPEFLNSSQVLDNFLYHAFCSPEKPKLSWFEMTFIWDNCVIGLEVWLLLQCHNQWKRNFLQNFTVHVVTVEKKPFEARATTLGRNYEENGKYSRVVL